MNRVQSIGGIALLALGVLVILLWNVPVSVPVAIGLMALGGFLLVAGKAGTSGLYGNDS